MYLLGLVTVFPCFLDVSRQRLFQAFTKDEIPDKKRHIFNVSFMLIAFLFEILAPYIKLSDIMNLNGAIFCFFFVYLIPLALHLKCYYDESRKTINSSSILTNE
jgi:sodium-coupled neutral amino acid transporter 9